MLLMCQEQALKGLPTKSDIQSLIDATVADAASKTSIVDDITARDALVPDNGDIAYVIDASGDATVNAGGATYIYRSSNTTWIKQSEAESMDLSLEWSADS